MHLSHKLLGLSPAESKEKCKGLWSAGVGCEGGGGGKLMPYSRSLFDGLLALFVEHALFDPRGEDMVCSLMDHAVCCMPCRNPRTT